MFDLEQEAWNYVRGFSFPQTEEHMKAFVNDWMNKEEQAELGMRYFERDIGISLEGKDVLEFACGNGVISFVLEKRGASVTGVDVDERVVDIATRWGQERQSDCRFLTVDHKDLPFDDQSFDFIYSTSTFEHLRFPEHSLRELGRVLRPSGVIFMAFPNRLWPRDAHTDLWFVPWLPNWLAPHYIDFRLPGWKVNFIRFYSYWDFLKILYRSGAPLEVVLPSIPKSTGWKYYVKRFLHALGIPYSAVTPGIILRLEKI